MPYDLAIKPKRSLAHLIWYGLLAGLAVLVTCLNLLPRADLHFRMQAQLVGPNLRILQLQRQVAEDRQAWQARNACNFSTKSSETVVNAENVSNAEKDAVWILGLKKLPQKSAGDTGFRLLTTAKATESMVVAEVWVASDRPLTTFELQQWLDIHSTPPTEQIVDRNIARQHRYAWWQKYSAAQYLVNAEKDQQAVQHRLSYQIKPLENEQSAFRNASFQQTEASDKSSSTEVAPPNDLVPMLRQKLEVAENEYTEAAAKLSENFEDRLGYLAFNGSSVVKPSGGTPLPKSIIISLFLAIFAATSVIAISYLSAPGNVTGEDQIKAVLSKHAIPLLAPVPNVDFDNQYGSVLQIQANLPAESNRVALFFRNFPIGYLILTSEIIVLTWCSGIGVRFFTDSHWRNLLVDQPLAAVARIWVGMSA